MFESAEQIERQQSEGMPAERDGVDAPAEAHHRIANSLSLIASLVRTRANRIVRDGRVLRCDEVERTLKEIATQIHGVGLLHRALSSQPAGDAIDLFDYLRQLCGSLQASFAYAGRVEFRRDEGTACPMSPEHVRPIALMISELVTNAMKYSHPSGVVGHITVGCHSDRAGKLVIEVADDGVGLPEGFDPMAEGNLGLHLIRSMSRGMGAVLQFESCSLGLRVRVTLPRA